MSKKTVICLALIFPLITGFSQDIEKRYDYPVKRGTAEWNSIKTYDSLRKDSQIPFAVVDKMNTNALLQSIIDYPLLADVLVF